ncbi:MAG: hypothetical protein ABSC42_13405 [Tepidisphaeraceae bacterium]|jgi:hypothetical protein
MRPRNAGPERRSAFRFPTAVAKSSKLNSEKMQFSERIIFFSPLFPIISSQILPICEASPKEGRKLRRRAKKWSGREIAFYEENDF